MKRNQSRIWQLIALALCAALLLFAAGLASGPFGHYALFPPVVEIGLFLYFAAEPLDSKDVRRRKARPGSRSLPLQGAARPILTVTTFEWPFSLTLGSP